MYGRLTVETYRNRSSLGVAAAARVTASLAHTIAKQGYARVIFACAPSQNEFLEALAQTASAGTGRLVDWTRVTAFHMDEYVGLEATNAQSFRRYLKEHFLNFIKIGQFYPLEGERRDRLGVISQYGSLLSEHPIDLICMGIGENGHIAFNDPGVADFADSSLVKEVELDSSCRQQQVNDGCFKSLDNVPRHALTLTVPVFLKARELSIHVPGERKAAAVKQALLGPVDAKCPASILRTHPNATLYLDTESGSLLT